MSWPSLDEYCAAIQNPSACFRDPELKNGAVARNKFGLPRVSSGNFACVFEVQSSGQRWAIRVFSREVTDQQSRYAHISNHLAQVRPAYMVDFSYIPEEIMVGGKRYPIVKMGWVEGIPIHNWVKQHRSWVKQHPSNENKTKFKTELQRMAASWRAMVGSLLGLDVAHSDLQQDNLLITLSGDLKLVDYDCMFVPAMRGQKAPEFGHPNWNHPKRTRDNFGSYLDQFPGLVGYISLLAVAAEPGLIDRHCNEDNIIFKKSDFDNPDNSQVFRDLRRSPDPNVKRLVNNLSEWCRQRVDYATLEGLCGHQIQQPVYKPALPPPVTKNGRFTVLAKKFFNKGRERIWAVIMIIIFLIIIYNFVNKASVKPPEIPAPEAPVLPPVQESPLSIPAPSPLKEVPVLRPAQELPRVIVPPPMEVNLGAPVNPEPLSTGGIRNALPQRQEFENKLSNRIKVKQTQKNRLIKTREEISSNPMVDNTPGNEAVVKTGVVDVGSANNTEIEQLFKTAAGYHDKREYEKEIVTCEEILKINPENEAAKEEKEKAEREKEIETRYNLR